MLPSLLELERHDELPMLSERAETRVIWLRNIGLLEPIRTTVLRTANSGGFCFGSYQTAGQHLRIGEDDLPLGRTALRTVPGITRLRPAGSIETHLAAVPSSGPKPAPDRSDRRADSLLYRQRVVIGDFRPG